MIFVKARILLIMNILVPIFYKIVRNYLEIYIPYSVSSFCVGLDESIQRGKLNLNILYDLLSNIRK